MRTSQTLMLEMSEHRSTLAEVTGRINSALEANQDASEDDVGKADKLTREIRALEVRYRAALLTEEEEDRAASDGDPTAEARKLGELEARCSVTAFLGEAVTGNDAKGAEAEYRAEVLGKDKAVPGFMPISLLATTDDAPRVEERAVTPVADAAIGLGSQADILPRIFTRTVASRLGVSMPSVPMGVRTWPILATGTTAAMKARSEEQEAVAGSFTGEELQPVRLTGSYEFRVEDLQMLRGLEDALRRDLRMVISDQMDEQVINGDGNAPNVEGFLGGGVPAGAAPGAAAFNYAGFVKAFTDGVDGYYSTMLGDIRAVIGQGTYGLTETLYRANNTDDSVYAVMARRAGGLSVTNRIPNKGEKTQEAIFSRNGFPGTTAVAPIWQGVQMIRDPYTGAQKGEVRITMLMLWNFKVIRAEAFYRRNFRHAA